MLTAIRRSVAVGALLTALAVLLLARASLGAQTATTPTTGTPSSGEMDMDMASPVAGTPVSGEQTIVVAPPSFEQTPLPAAGQDQMGQMMDDCIDMMDMMGGGMMGGDMPGPMGGGDMPGPMGGGDMPGPMGGGDMPGPMDSPMDQCLASMDTQARGGRSGLMDFSTDQCQEMLSGGAMPGR